MRWVFGTILLMMLMTVGILGVRGQKTERRPLMLVPDMDFQPRYDAQAESQFFADGRSMRPPPAGTVAFAGGGARGGEEPLNGRAIYGGYLADAGSPRSNPNFLREDRAFYLGKQGEDLVKSNPMNVTLTLLKRGQDRFQIFCSVCHGGTGSGNGITTQYGLNVPTYHDDRVRSFPDGQIFDVITNGKGTMMPYGHALSPADRWAVVAYVRALQKSQSTTVEELRALVRDGNIKRDELPETLQAEVNP